MGLDVSFFVRFALASACSKKKKKEIPFISSILKEIVNKLTN